MNVTRNFPHLKLQLEVCFFIFSLFIFIISVTDFRTKVLLSPVTFMVALSTLFLNGFDTQSKNICTVLTPFDKFLVFKAKRLQLNCHQVLILLFLLPLFFCIYTTHKKQNYLPPPYKNRFLKIHISFGSVQNNK